MAESTICTVTVDDREFHVERVGDVLRVSPNGSPELAETIALAHLPDEARTAVERGDYDDSTLRIVAQGVADAIATRGA